MTNFKLQKLTTVIKTITLANALIFSASAYAQQAERQYSVELSDPSKPMFLDVEMYMGNITIEGYEGQTVEIVAEVLNDFQPDKHKDKWQKNWKRVDTNKPMRSTEGLTPVSHTAFNLEIMESSNRVEIESEFGSKPVAIVVKVPQNASLDVNLYTGDSINISNISGNVEVESHIGNINGTLITGPIVAETHASDIVIEFNTFSDSAPSSFATHSGDIDISLLANTASTVEVQNYQGQVLSGLGTEFESVDKVNKKQRENGQKIEIGSQLQAKLNGGGQVMSINTYSGNVYLRQK
ncbi:MAG: hypothetical protein GJ680_02665 [Alteromonadaceae bacterium]|nr:hypothetical protein [Alteromonadaceae bacterium]